MSSVCNFGRSGSHKLEILETNGTDNPNIFALRSPKAIHLLPGEHGEILARPEVWWEKVACCSTKTAISPKRAKVDENLLWRAYRNSPTLFRTVPFSTLYGLPRLRVRNRNPKLQSLLSQERVKLRTANLDCTFTGSIQTKTREKFGRKGSVGVSRNCPNF